MGFFIVIYMCCARLHYLCFWSVHGAVVVLDCEIIYIYIYIYVYMYICIYSFNPSSDAVGLTATLAVFFCYETWALFT